MKKLLLATFIFSSFVMTAQNAYHQCGTVHDEATLQAAIDAIMKSKEAVANGLAAERDDEITFIPVKYHLIGTSNPATYPKIGNILGMHCKLNEEFEEHNIQFYINNGFNFVQSDAAYANPGDAQPVLNLQKDPQSMNVFIGNNATPPGGGAIDGGVTLGYYSPGNDWIVLRKSEANYSSGTLPHEAGHFFSLPHPFLGWDCTSWLMYADENPGECAPENAPCQGPPVELQDGSNCETAGDLICDTPPDYNLGFGTNSCNYNGSACDPSGAQVEPMGNNHMGYFNNCADYQFTPMQVELMLANIADVSRVYLTFDALADGGPWSKEKITSTAVLNTPADDSTTDFGNGVEFDWEPVENAQFYLLQVAQSSNMSLLLREYTDWQSGAYLSDLDNNTQYYWRVKPYNEYSACADWSEIRTFTTGSATTNVENIEGVNTFSVSPNPAQAGTILNVSVNAQNNFTADVQIVGMDGKVLQTIAAQDFRTGANNVTLNAEDFAQGLYFVRLHNKDGVMNRKVVLF